MKILCICEGGFTRSVCLAGHLKNTGGKPDHDAITAAWRCNSKETMGMLCDWADRVIVMQPYMVKAIHEIRGPEGAGKTLVCDVGPDTYSHALDPRLVKQVQDWCHEKGLKPRQEQTP